MPDDQLSVLQHSYTTIQLKRGLAASWTSKNLILASGEVGVETDTNRMKVGDGTTPWNQLTYTKIDVDGALSQNSENPVQNKVIFDALTKKGDIITTITVSSASSLAMTPGSVYKWTVPANTQATVSFDGSQLSGKFTEIPVHISLGENSSVSSSTIEANVTRSGWYALTWDGTTATLKKTDSSEAQDVHDSTRNQTVQQTLDDLHPATFTPGNVVMFDEDGHPVDGEVPADNIAQQDGYYAAQGLGAKTAENFVDPNATPNAASFGFRTAAGEVSISDDSHGQVDKMEGVTHTINQQVKPHSSKSMTGDGSIQATDGTAGNAEGLTLTGDTYVRNQLYKYNWESPASNDSRTITELENQKGTMITIHTGSSSDSVWLRASGRYVVGHTYLLVSKVTATYNAQIRPMYSSVATTTTATVTANTATRVSIPFTATAANNYFIIYYNLSNTAQANDTITFDELQIIDLTRLCSGTALAPTLFSTWDSLKARIPEYASTVAYDTGTVVNSRPGVKVTGKNLFGGTVYVIGMNQSRPYIINSTVTSPTVTASAFRGIGFKCHVIPGMNYTVSGSVTGHSGVMVGFYAKEADCVSYDKCLSFTSNSSFTVPANATWLVANWYANNSGTTITFSDIQLELGSTATTYEPYFDGGSAQASADLVSLTNVADTEDVVKGKRTARIASVDMGTLNWSDYADSGTSWTYGYTTTQVSGKAIGLLNLICSKYVTSSDINVDKVIRGKDNSNRIYISDSSFSGKTGAQIAAALSGQMLYYELATPSVTDITPSTITLQNGNNTVLQTAGSVNQTRLSLGYQGTSYNLTLTKNSKFVKRIDGADSYVSQGSSNGTLAVVGGRDKLFNLTRWFGKGREPASVDAFYKLYPAFKYADVPYTAGALVNFKGASIRTVGFNAYDHATGTARLIGGNEYQVCGTYESVSYVDQWGHAEELRVSSEGIFTPANDGVLTVTGGNGTDTCVHLTWSGYKNYGEPEYKWEPYIENTKELPVATYFPDGMNQAIKYDGTEEVHDELSASQLVKRCGVKTFSQLSWSYHGTSAAWKNKIFYAAIPDMLNIPNEDSTGICSAYEYNLAIFATQGTFDSFRFQGKIIYVKDDRFQDIQSFTQAMGSTVIIYPLATPVVTPINPQLNLTYSVNDFGTEEMIPYPDSITPASTEFHGYIKYSVDFLRLNIHLNEWYNTIKTLVQNEPNYVLKDKTYDTLGSGTAFNLIDRNAQGSGREFTYDTSSGDVDLTDGTAVVKKYEGSTLMANQLVADTNVNTGNSANGVIEVTDAVTADAKGLTMYGESYVKNQLVSTDPVEKTESSSDGVVTVTDAVSGNANGLTMKGDSWVRNQLIDYSNVQYGSIAGYSNATTTIDRAGKTNTLTVVNRIGSNGISFGVSSSLLKANRTYMVCCYATASVATGNTQFSWDAKSNIVTFALTANTRTFISGKLTMIDDVNLVVYADRNTTTGGMPVGSTFTVDNLMVVDLTQLCNGDSTKIAAIQTWDDLVAQYPEYAHYVPYDTGTVMGIQPSVTNYGDEYAYGVIMDMTQDTLPCQRVELHNGVVSNVDSFSSMPAHDWHRCVMDDLANRHVSYYLDPEDSDKKYNGTFKGVTSNGSASVLTGADGDVMARVDIVHWRFEENYNGQAGKNLYLVSDRPFTGSKIHPWFYTSPNGDTPREQYVGAFRASVCDADGNPLNTTEGAVSQNGGTSSSRKARSIAGALPWVNVTLGDLRTAAQRNGSSLVNLDYGAFMFLMTIIEKASIDSQSISAGYTNGKTAAYWCWRKSGRTNYGNGTGQTLAVGGTTDDDNFYSLKVNNVQLYRDTAIDANGYYGWSNHAASNPTRYWTNTATPANGSTAYSDTSGTASAYTTASWSTTSAANKIIQFQYRGIENLFGEVWEFNDGVQKYETVGVTAVTGNSKTFNRDSSQDATGAYAWKSTDGTSTVWTASATPAANATCYTDSAKTTAASFTVSPSAYSFSDGEYWHTNATSDYTSTAQHGNSSAKYYREQHAWPAANGYVRTFDPRTFLPFTTGDGASASKWMRDYFYRDNATGSRVLLRGGSANIGAAAGIGCAHVTYGPSNSTVHVSGRLSA